MLPYGALGSRLRATASALTLAEQMGIGAVIVWTNAEHGYTGEWEDLFAGGWVRTVWYADWIRARE